MRDGGRWSSRRLPSNGKDLSKCDTVYLPTLTPIIRTQFPSVPSDPRVTLRFILLKIQDGRKRLGKSPACEEWKNGGKKSYLSIVLILLTLYS